MFDIFASLANAQRKYDRETPFDDIDEDEEDIVPEFDCYWIEELIADFANAEDADKWLEDNGIKEMYGKGVIGAEVLQALCKIFKDKPNTVYDAAGIAFWTTMREIGCNVYAYRYGRIVRY